MSAGEDNAGNIEGQNLDGPETSTGRVPKNDSSEEPSADGSGSVSPVRKGGPRTAQGKERSKNNATTHGIFSKVVVVTGESSDEFDSLLGGLRTDFQPVGMVEELLVEKLAALFWRSRRLLIAEAAEVERGTEVDLWSKFERDKQEAAIFLKSEEKSRAGLLSKIENRVIWGKCLQNLELLQLGVEAGGFNTSVVGHLLKVLFGDAEMAARTDPVLKSYMVCSDTGTCPPPDPKDPKDQKEARELAAKLATPDGRKAKFLEDLQVKIDEVEKYPDMVARFTASGERLKLLCGKVPNAPELDRLLRYEASLDRSFDRTLSQLERQQRMRRGQRVLPNVEVHHSMS